MMTGLEDEQSVARAYAVGATDFVCKPVNWFVLPHRVRYLLRASHTILDLERAYKELQVLDKAKDAFLSSVSHELRTPLTSIRSCSEILFGYQDIDPQERDEFVNIINLESERLTRLIDDVLDIARIEAGQVVWKNADFSLERVVEDTVRVHTPLLRKAGLRMVVECDEDRTDVFADRDRIQQVITNLLGNAIKFSPPGRQIRIHLEAIQGKRNGEPSRWLKVGVSDQGPGIDGKDFAVIFERFGQACEDTLTEKPAGTGLGLPISKEIVTHYGGNIWVESEKGKGSSFWFTVPAKEDLLHPARTQASGEDETPARTGKSVLVLHENPSVRRSLRFLLHREGYRVLEAPDPGEALELARRETIDLITLDLMMPAMTGYGVLEQLRQDPATATIPVLIVSVLEDKNQGITLGANDYLTNPCKEDELVGKVRALQGDARGSVLLVDDNPAVLEMLRLQLEEGNYPVSVAHDGQEALEFLEHQIPGLVVLDVAMPRKNGYEVLRSIRSNPATRDLPVIVLSAYPPCGEQEKLVDLGIQAYLEKSGGMASLLDRIDSLLVPALHAS